MDKVILQTLSPTFLVGDLIMMTIIHFNFLKRSLFVVLCIKKNNYRFVGQVLK